MTSDRLSLYVSPDADRRTNLRSAWLYHFIPPIRNLIRKIFKTFLGNNDKALVSDGRRQLHLSPLSPIRVNYLFSLTQYSIPSFKPGWKEGRFLSSPVLSPNQVLTFYNLLSIAFSTVATIS